MRDRGFSLMIAGGGCGGRPMHQMVLAVSCDVTDYASQEAAVAAVIDRFGGLDALFANAGIGSKGAGTAGGDPEAWRQMVLTNVLGVMYSVKAAHEAIIAAKGHILITSSGAGRKVIPGSVYGATKWFVQGLAGNLAEEMREWGGRCTLITPGMVDTPFFDERKPGALVADDIARAVVYALSQPDNVLAGEIWVEPLKM